MGDEDDGSVLAVSHEREPILILGGIEMHDTTDKGSLHPTSVAFGVVLGLVALVTTIVVHLAQIVDDSGDQQRQCLNNMRSLVMAARMYSDDYFGKFPPLDSWNEALRPYLKGDKSFVCPKAGRDSPPTYAMNRALDGLAEKAVAMPDKTVLFFESIPGENLSGGPELMPPTPRHMSPFGYYIVCFTDGGVRAIVDSRVLNLNWKPDYEEDGYVHPSMRKAPTQPQIPSRNTSPP